MREKEVQAAPWEDGGKSWDSLSLQYFWFVQLITCASSISILVMYCCQGFGSRGKCARSGQGLPLDGYGQVQMSPKKTHFRTQLNLSAKLVVSLSARDLTELRLWQICNLRLKYLISAKVWTISKSSLQLELSWHFCFKDNIGLCTLLLLEPHR